MAVTRPGSQRSRLPGTLALAAVVIPLVAGCPPSRRAGVLPRVWAIGSSVVVDASAAARDETLCYSRSDNLITLVGARNETVAFTFVLTAADGPAEGIRVSVDDLVSSGGVLSNEHVRLFRHWPVRVDRFRNWYLRSVGPRRPQPFPDALVPSNAPVHGQPWSLVDGGSLPLWVDITIPSSTRAGVYRTRIAVHDRAGRTNHTPVELTVLDIALSAETALPTLAGVDLAPLLSAMTSLDPANLKAALRDNRGRRALLSAFKLLHDHGLDPYTDQIRPGFSQDVDGSVVLDWESYDAFCGPLIDGGAFDDGRPVAFWPIPVDLREPDPSRFGGIDAVRYRAVLRDMLAKARDHFEERGWLNKSFVYFDLPQRPDPGPAELDRLRSLGRLCRVVDPRLAFLSTLIPQPMTPFGWPEHHFQDLSDIIDIWATPARFDHPATLARQRGLGKLTWLSPDRPPFSGSLAVEAPRVHARSLAWQAFLHGHDGIRLARTTSWPARPFDKPIDAFEQSSESWLIYPGGFFGLDEPVPSVRLKQLRQGLQDYQYLRMLTARGHGETARLAASSLIKAAGTDAYGDNYQDGVVGRRVDDPELWQLARTLLTDELAGALDERSDGPRGGASDNAWRAFLRGTRGIEMWAEPVRLMLDDRPGATGYLAHFDVGVRSELRTPLSGSLGFPTLPPKWRSISDLVRVGPIGEMALERSRLTAAMPAIPPTDLDGHLAQAIRFDGGASGAVETQAVLSIVRVVAASGPITIDGSLRDWPPTASNIAAGFRVLGPAAESSRKPADSQTLAYWCRQGDTLCIGIHAAKPTAAGAEDSAPDTVRYGNVVRYEDLMPVGEDLIEILFDPTNAGTQCDDLFYIVIKATGQAVFQRGIGTTPPIGRCVPWDARARWMIEDAADHWSAEIAIPIASFGRAAASQPIWGMNVARLEPHHGEYSDWAGATRHCYDPRTLGNLVWPD